MESILYQKKNKTVFDSIKSFRQFRTKREQKIVTLFALVFISLGLFTLDYVTGPVIQVPFFYVLLVTLIVWFHGAKSAYIFGMILPLLRIAAHYFWSSPWSLSDTFFNILIQISILLAAVYLISRIKRLILEIRTLRGNLSICAYCTKIYNENAEWEEIESYISRQSEVKFSHGVCPECEKIQFGEHLIK